MKSKLLAAVAAATACLVASVGAGAAHAAVTYVFTGFEGQIGFTYVSPDFVTTRTTFDVSGDPYCVSLAATCSATFLPEFGGDIEYTTATPDGFVYGSTFHFGGLAALTTPGTYQDLLGPQFGIDRGTLVVSGAPTVPEPSTWALLIGGFGLAGAALRRRRPATA